MTTTENKRNVVTAYGVSVCVCAYCLLVTTAEQSRCYSCRPFLWFSVFRRSVESQKRPIFFISVPTCVWAWGTRRVLAFDEWRKKREKCILYFALVANFISTHHLWLFVRRTSTSFLRPKRPKYEIEWRPGHLKANWATDGGFTVNKMFEIRTILSCHSFEFTFTAYVQYRFSSVVFVATNYRVCTLNQNHSVKLYLFDEKHPPTRAHNINL